MRASLSLLIPLLVLAGSAYAQTQPWTVLPLNDAGLEPDERARMMALPVMPDVLEPLWDRSPALTLVTNALGAPDVVKGTEAIWEFSTLEVSVQQTRALTIIEIKTRREPDPSHPRALDIQPGGVASFIEAATGSCSEVFARLGQPSMKERSYYAWIGVGRGRDIAAALECGRRGNPDQVRSLRLIQCELAPADQAALLATSRPSPTLPGGFEQIVSKGRVANPRELWPTGFNPGQSVARVVEQIGLPTYYFDANRPSTELRWGLALQAKVRDGLVRDVTLPVQGVAAYARLGVTSPLIAMLGKPLAPLVELLGQPIARGGSNTWRWMARGHELAIEAQVRDGLVHELEFSWWDTPPRESLPCAAHLGGKPSRAPKPIEYRGRDFSLGSAQIIPFKLWFGATQRDVIDRLGSPRECSDDGHALGFPGVVATFSEEGLQRIEVDVDFLSAELYASKDPLIALLRKGPAAIEAHFGPPGAPKDFFPGEQLELAHGPQRLFVTIDTYQHDGAAPTLSTYRVRMVKGFDFDIITGLRLDALPAADREALGLAPVVVADSVFDLPMILLATDKPALGKKVSGKLIDALGANWMAITAMFGEPTHTAISGERLFLIWDPPDASRRKFAFACTGATLICNELHLEGPRE